MSVVRIDIFICTNENLKRCQKGENTVGLRINRPQDTSGAYFGLLVDVQTTALRDFPLEFISNLSGGLQAGTLVLSVLKPICKLPLSPEWRVE